MKDIPNSPFKVLFHTCMFICLLMSSIFLLLNFCKSCLSLVANWKTTSNFKLRNLVDSLIVLLLRVILCCNIYLLLSFTRHMTSFQPSPDLPQMGYMYEFDCKEVVGSIDAKWIKVAFEHKVSWLHVSVLCLVS